MPRKTQKISMDTAFKSIMREMDLPRQKDIEKLNAKLDRLEKLLKTTQKERTRTTSSKIKASGIKRADSATAAVLSLIQSRKRGIGITDLQKKTGFDDKKLRNIVFRLYKLGKINRVGRGKYVGV